MPQLDDELVNRVTWKIPNALALIGSRSGEVRNAMTASWITQLSMEPVLIGVGIDNKAVTHGLIVGGGSFTVNLWSSEDTKVFIKFSKPAVYVDGTLNERAVAEAVTGAPTSSSRSPGSTVSSGTATTTGRILSSPVRWWQPGSTTTNSGRPPCRIPE